MSGDFKPMLAQTGQLVLPKLVFPLWVLPKYDGVRGLVHQGVLRSRNLLPIPNAHVRSKLSSLLLEGLDGELLVGSATQARACGAAVTGVMTHSGQPNAVLHVFDTWLPQQDHFHVRHDQAIERALALKAEGYPVSYIPRTLVENVEDLLALEETALTEGHEGLILRHIRRPYKFGRSTMNEQGLLRLKRFATDEAIILEVIEELRNDNPAKKNALGRTERSSHKENLVPTGKMGALRVRDVKTGVEFNIGTGFNAEDQVWFWENQEKVVAQQTMVSYDHFLGGRKDKPRFPSYKGIRHKNDLS